VEAAHAPPISEKMPNIKHRTSNIGARGEKELKMMKGKAIVPD
jgi:hypothetical protein